MSWLDDDSIYSIFNKPNHRGPGTHFDEDKAHVSSKPIPASGGAEKEDILMTDFMPSAATVKKESEELFAEVGNQGGHAGNTAADEGDEDDDDAPARPQGRGGKRGGAGRKADPPEVKAAKATARAETAAEAKVIEAAKLAAIRANLAAAVETPAASEGGGAAAAAPKPPRSKAPSRRGSVEDTETLAAAASVAAQAEKAVVLTIDARFKEQFQIESFASRAIVKTHVETFSIPTLKAKADTLGMTYKSTIKKDELVEKLLSLVFH
jgi:hypothetical protein